MQELWINGLDWDDKIPDHHIGKVKAWFQELKDLAKVQVPRCLQNPSNIKGKSIHVFTDASSEAYGAVAYQQCLYESGGGYISTHIVQG